MRLLPARIDEMLRQAQMLIISGHTIEPHQCQLDFLVPVIAVFLARLGTEHRVDMVDISQEHIEHRTLASSLEIRDGGFQQMTGAIQFMIVAQVREASLWLNRLVIRVEIPISHLRGTHQFDHLINPFFQRRIRPND